MMMFDSESCIRALCLVDGDDPERPGLLRLADVNAAGRLIAPAPGKGWADRQRFYRQDGPGELGKLGFWEFQGTRNLKNPDRWFIKSRFLPARPVRIDDHFWSLSTGGIINSLRNGFAHPLDGASIIITRASKENNNSFSGIYIAFEQLESAGDGYLRLTDDVLSLPQFTFTNANIYRTGSNLLKTPYFFWNDINRHEFRGMTFLQTVSPITAVKRMFAKTLSWKKFHEATGRTHQDLDNIRELIAQVADADFIANLKGTYHCTDEDAESYIERFISNAERYVDREDITDEIIVSSIARHPELIEKQKNLIAAELEADVRKARDERERLKKENEDYAKELKERAQADAAAAVKKASADAAAALAETESALKAKKDDLKALEEEILALELMKEEAAREAEEKRRLADGVNAEIQKKLAGATDEIARVIAGMPFLKAFSQGNSVPQVQPAAAAPAKVASWRFAFSPAVSGSLIKVSSWKDCLGLIEDNLEDIGIDPKRNRALAAFLYASYLNSQSLLLAGPCGTRITNAFSLAVSGMPAAELACGGPFDAAAFRRLETTPAKVVSVCNPFRPEWVEPLMRLTERTDKILVFSTPFEEDIRIESKNLFDYAIPILTTTVMEKITVQEPAVGSFAANFKHYRPVSGTLAHNRLFTRMGMTPLTKSRIERVLATAQSILSGNELKEEAEYLYGLLPYSYVAGHADVWAEGLAAARLDPSLKQFLQRFAESVRHE